MPYVIIAFLCIYAYFINVGIEHSNKSTEITINKIDTLDEKELRLFTKMCVKNRTSCELQ